MLYIYKNHSPLFSLNNNFIAPTASLIGQVTLSESASIWFNCVLRADNAPIMIGKGSNVQDGTVMHVDEGTPVLIGDYVTIGHATTVHACQVGDGSLIGMGATVLSRVVIGKNSIVGAGALVTEDKIFPDRSLILGSPARRIRELTDKEVMALRENADHYIALSKECLSGLVEA